MKKKYFGIAGFGVAGKSILRFYRLFTKEFSVYLSEISGCGGEEYEWSIRVFEQKKLSEADRETLEVAVVFDAWDSFVDGIDLVWYSTGIDTAKYMIDGHKVLKELDIFSYFWRLPSISITGSIGKTTLTRLLYEIYQIDSCALVSASEHFSGCTHLRGCSYKRHALGGNIGIGLLDLIPHEPIYHGAVLELSSWQLEGIRSFAPRIGIWTNLYPNHLDRHTTMKAYFTAKASFLRLQTADEYALLGSTIISGENKQFFMEERTQWQGKICIVFDRKMSVEEKAFLDQQNCSYLFLDEDSFVVGARGKEQEHLFHYADIPDVGFLDTWIFALGALYFSGVRMSWLSTELLRIAYQRCIDAVGVHRLQLCAQKKGIAFYNDSKSTVPSTTEAAIKQLKKKYTAIILILGGLNKGADRSALVRLIQQDPSIKQVFRFGPGSYDLEPFIYCQTLEEVIDKVAQSAVEGDAVLFSPSGSSYDIYSDYKERGNAFMQLVEALCI